MHIRKSVIDGRHYHGEVKNEVQLTCLALKSLCCSDLYSLSSTSDLFSTISNK